MCTVVNKYKHTPTKHDLYIGRGSPLGNPYTHNKGVTLAEYIVNTREEAIEAYKVYFYEVLLFSPSAIKLLELIDDNTNLVCFCSPKECHGIIIKEYWINNIRPKKIIINRLIWYIQDELRVEDSWLMSLIIENLSNKSLKELFSIAKNNTNIEYLDII